MNEENSTEPEIPTSGKSRRLLRWLLGTLAVFVVGTLLLFGYRYQQQMALIERIEAAGGMVKTKPLGSDWLRELIGAERLQGFEDVVDVIICNDTSGSWLCQLSGQPLIQIQIQAGKLNQESLQCLGEMRELKWLRISDNPELPDSLFEEVAKISSLVDFSFSSSRLPENAFLKLGQLSKINRIKIRGSNFDETSIAELKHCKSLSILWLPGSTLTDRGLKEISQLTQLDESLDLSGARITDAGLRYILSLKRLQRLRLAGTNVSDAGIAHLKTLTNLTELNLSATRVTTGGVEELRNALPKCEIVY